MAPSQQSTPALPQAGAGRPLWWPTPRAAVTAALLLAVGALLCCALGTVPDLAWLQSRQAELRALHAENPIALAACLFCCLTVLSALALPGCSALALAAGAYFGMGVGTALVLLASTVGATASFLAARHLLRGAVQRRWGPRLAAVESGLARDGAFYLFSLRVAPLIPYGLVNPLMGLSKMPLRQFFWISLLGMLAGSAAYVYAGVALGSGAGPSTGWSGLWSPRVMLALGLLAVLPWCGRAVWRRWGYGPT